MHTEVYYTADIKVKFNDLIVKHNAIKYIYILNILHDCNELNTFD